MAPPTFLIHLQKLLVCLSSDMVQLQRLFRFVIAVWLHDKELTCWSLTPFPITPWLSISTCFFSSPTYSLHWVAQTPVQFHHLVDVAHLFRVFKHLAAWSLSVYFSEHKTHTVEAHSDGSEILSFLGPQSGTPKERLFCSNRSLDHRVGSTTI